MSTFGDFQKVWRQRFPDRELPQTWEADVRANLSKHRQRVAALNAELEKECQYVEFLEHLLADRERAKQIPKFNTVYDDTETSVVVESSENKFNVLDECKNSDLGLSKADIIHVKKLESESNVVEHLANENEQNVYDAVVEVGGASSQGEPVSIKDDNKVLVHGKTDHVETDEVNEVEVESNRSVPKEKYPAPTKTPPREPIPVQTVPTVKQNMEACSDSQKNEEKPEIESHLTDPENIFENILDNQEVNEKVSGMDCLSETIAISSLDAVKKKAEKINANPVTENNKNETKDYEDKNIDTVATDKANTSSERSLIRESSKKDCNGDCVAFLESYDYYQEVPLKALSLQKSVECLFNKNETSFDAESPKYETYMNNDNFLQNPKVASNKLHVQSRNGVLNDEAVLLVQSFSSDHEMQPDQVTDYSEEKGGGTCKLRDDALDMDSGDTSYHDDGDLRTTFQQLLSMRVLTDIDFEVKDERETQIFRAHKLVLSLWSPVFADMFYCTKAKTSQLIRVKNVDITAFRFALRYMYGYECVFRQYKHAFKVYMVAERYQIEGLKNRAKSFIISAQVTKANALDLLEPASYFGSESLKKRCFKILQTQTNAVLRKANLYDISASAIETILSLQELSLPSEYQLIEWIMAWAKNQYFKESSCSHEREVIEPLLPSLRFHDFSCEEFANFVKIHKDFFKESEAFSIFMNIADPGSWPLPEWVDTTKGPRLYKT